LKSYYQWRNGNVTDNIVAMIMKIIVNVGGNGNAACGDGIRTDWLTNSGDGIVWKENQWWRTAGGDGAKRAMALLILSSLPLFLFLLTVCWYGTITLYTLVTAVFTTGGGWPGEFSPRGDTTTWRYFVCTVFYRWAGWYDFTWGVLMLVTLFIPTVMRRGVWFRYLFTDRYSVVLRWRWYMAAS